MIGQNRTPRTSLARVRTAWMSWMVLLLAALAAPPRGSASAQESFSEVDVKAAALYLFAKFTQWPASAFSSENEPIVVGVIGHD